MANKGIQSLLQRFKTPEYKEYFMSTHFWAPFSNYGIPLAALADITRDPKLISGKMTIALCLYSAAFMRFAWRIRPRNLLLLGCHVLNETAQVIELARYIKYHFIEGNE